MNAASPGNAENSSVSSSDGDALARLKALARELASRVPAGNELAKVLDEQYRQAILGGDTDGACRAAIEMALIRMPEDAQTALRLLKAVYAVGRAPHHLEARYQEARVRKQVGDDEGAYRCLSEVIEVSEPKVAAALWYTRAVWLIDDQQESEAEEALLKVVAAGPERFYGAAAIQLARLYGRAKDWDGAREWATKAMTDPRSEVAWTGAELLAGAAAIQGSPAEEDFALFHKLASESAITDADEGMRLRAANALLLEGKSLAHRGATTDAVEILAQLDRLFRDDSEEAVRAVAAEAKAQRVALKEAVEPKKAEAGRGPGDEHGRHPAGP